MHLRINDGLFDWPLDLLSQVRLLLSAAQHLERLWNIADYLEDTALVLGD